MVTSGRHLGITGNVKEAKHHDYQFLEESREQSMEEPKRSKTNRSCLQSNKEVK